MDYTNNIELLIAKVLSGEASVPEIESVNSWKKLSSENLKYFQGMEIIFQKAAEARTQQKFDTDAAWKKVMHKVASAKSDAPVYDIRKFSGTRFMRIAAIVLIALGFGLVVYKVITPAEITPVTFASGNIIKELILSDSTSIVVNRNSTLAYTFSNNKRKIELHGEALFTPANDPERPFEVMAAGILIRDIGTTFNVKAPDGNDSMVVQVFDGEVVLTSESNQSVVLKKGEEAVYLKSRDEFIRKAVSDTNAIAYKTKIFVFENASLQAVVQKLNEVYGLQISFTPAISSCHITATFKNEKPDAIIEIIAATLQLKVIRDNNTILLDGTVCED